MKDKKKMMTKKKKKKWENDFSILSWFLKKYIKKNKWELKG